MEGVIMVAALNKFPTKLSPQAPDRNALLSLRLSAPARNPPFDAAHEHWPEDNFRNKHRDRANEKHCPPEVYIG
jgi:hypothetical protein